MEKANNIVSAIHERIGATQNVEHPRAEVVSRLGDFSGLVNLKPDSPESTLVSTIDGVGTKSSFTPKLYKELGRDTNVAFSNLGRDIVNHCVNDMLVKGGNPLMFLDYIAASKLEKSVVSSIVSGTLRIGHAAACRVPDARGFAAALLPKRAPPSAVQPDPPA